jgi:hypothetical protein
MVMGDNFKLSMAAGEGVEVDEPSTSESLDSSEALRSARASPASKGVGDVGVGMDEAE